MKTAISAILITLMIATVIYAQDSPQWHLPEGVKARLGKGKINQIAYSPDETILAAATYIGVWIYDVQTGKELQLLATEPVNVKSIAFSPDGTTLVSSGIGAPISLWDVESGRLHHTFPIESSRSNYGVAFSPDGTIIASHGQIGTVQLWNSDTGENIGTLEGQEAWGGLNSIQFSPDGNTLATGWSDGTICLWDVNTGTIKHTLTENEGWVLTLEFFPDGKTLASGSGAQENAIRLWDVETGNLIRTLIEHYDWILDIAVSPHGNILIACDNHYEMRIWNLDTGEILNRFSLYSHRPTSVIFSADGNTFAIGGANTHIYIWDTDTAMKIRKFTDHAYISEQAAFSPTENTIATSGSGGTALLFDTDTGEFKRKLIGHSGYIRTLAYSQDGTILATGRSDETLQLLDVETGSPRLPPIDTPGGYPYSITFSHDGELVACLVDDYFSVHLNTYRTATGEQLHNTKVYTHMIAGDRGDIEIENEHAGRLKEIVFSPDGSTIASCTSGNVIRFWDGTNGTHLRKLVTDKYGSRDIAFSPDGQTITGMSFGFLVHQWNVETGKELQAIQLPGDTRGAKISEIALSFQGTMGAIGFMDGTVQLWDMANRTQIRILKGHTSWIRNLMFSPDGRTLASSSADGTTLLWDIEPIIPSPTVVKLSPAKVQSPAIGEHLTLSLEIAEGQDVAGYQATINYDTTALTYIDSSNGDYLSANAFTAPPVVDGNTIRFATTSFGEQSNGNGTLATITFEVIAQKASTVTLSDVLLTDSLGGSTVPQIAGTEILKSFVQPEDVNGDGVVDITDLTFVAANLGNRGSNPADVNGDGVVNIVDLALVAAAIGNNNNGAAPTLLSDLPSREDVQLWLHEARQLNLSDPDFQRGVIFLENLLKSLTPKETALLPNYPNPFNPETWIPYQLASPADVSITIYASDGQLVRKLTLGQQTVGIHQQHWDGNNDQGEKVASGIYFYTLRAGEYTATRKMSIAK